MGEIEIKQPVFIIGTGRCGSTIFQQIFCEHPNLAWLSALGDLFPAKHEWNGRMLKMVDTPLIGNILRRQKPFKPWEPYGIWNDCSPGFSEPCRDLTEIDATVLVKQRVQKAMAAMLNNKRNRLLVKITGWPRIKFIREIFPDAKFIHIMRDGRAVVNSLLNVDWWSGWRGPQNWRWGELTPPQYEEWVQHERSFVALAGIEWKILMDAMEIATADLSSDCFMEIKYEDLCTDPSSIFKKITQFCNLSYPHSFEQAVQQYQLKNTNAKWQKDLSSQQQQTLHAVLGQYLLKYGY